VGIGAAEQQAHRQTTGARPHRGETPAAGGAADAIPVAVANSRLTAILGLTLLILFALQVVTVLAGVRSVLTWHVVLGLILLPPVGLKLTSVTWRMVSYHRGRDGFADITPPPPVLRVLGLFLARLTVPLAGQRYYPAREARVGAVTGPARPPGQLQRLAGRGRRARRAALPAGRAPGQPGLGSSGWRGAAGRRGAVVAASLADYLQHVPLP